MRDLYPGYDVLAKRDTPSWNDKTREVIDARLVIERDAPRFFEAAEYRLLIALCDCICPQEAKRIPVAALVDEKMYLNRADGFRLASMPEMRAAWRCGLAAIDEAAQTIHARSFCDCPQSLKQEIVERMSSDALDNAGWGGMSQRDFFESRVLPTSSKVTIHIRPPGARSVSADPQVRAAMSVWILNSATRGKPPRRSQAAKSAH